MFCGFVKKMKPPNDLKRLFPDSEFRGQKDMKKQLSDEQFDQMMSSLLNDAALDEATVNQVADSPTLWWAVQRQINREKEVCVSPWPPIGKFWRWLMLGVPAAVAAAVLIASFAFQPSPVEQQIAVNVAPMADQVNHSQPDVAAPTTSVESLSPKSVNKLPVAIKFATVKNAERKAISITRAAAPTVAKKSSEIKTDFIALSYARNPDSGQIVRVRVPSSMMVTLGLVASVEKPSNLVDAEVLVGDDGLTRSIRFIH